MRRLSSLFNRSIGLVDQILGQWAWGEVRERGQVSFRLAQHDRDRGVGFVQAVGNSFELVTHGVGGRLGKDRADPCPDHRAVGFGCLG